MNFRSSHNWSMLSFFLTRRLTLKKLFSSQPRCFVYVEFIRKPCPCLTHVGQITCAVFTLFSPGVSCEKWIFCRNEILFLWKSLVNHLEDILQESVYLGHALIMIIFDCTLMFGHALEPRVKYLFLLIRWYKIIFI